MKLPSHEKLPTIGKKKFEVLQNQDGLFPHSPPELWPWMRIANSALSLQAARNVVKAFAEGNEELRVDLQVKT